MHSPPFDFFCFTWVNGVCESFVIVFAYYQPLVVFEALKYVSGYFATFGGFTPSYNCVGFIFLPT